ncbi:thioredoxin domain-containing protein 15 [Polypterus senegalus]
MGWQICVKQAYCFIFTLCIFALGQILAAEKNVNPNSQPIEESVLDDLLKENDQHTLKSHEEESEFARMSKIQFKTAEIADAMLSIIPGDGETEPTDSSCQDGAECHLGETANPSSPTDSREVLSENSGLGDLVTLGMVPVDTATEHEENSTEMAKMPKVNCEERNITGVENFTVHILNASQDLMDFLNANGTECSVVLFYTTWCHFSASLAPHFNALPRVFPSMQFLALDAAQHSSLSTRFGTVAVPNILLFQGAKPMARFNQTDRTLGILKSFIVNQTGIEANSEEDIREDDYSGPLPNVPVKSIDWLLVFSVFFICSFAMYAVLRTDSIRWLIPGQVHEHQD